MALQVVYRQNYLENDYNGDNDLHAGMIVTLTTSNGEALLVKSDRSLSHRPYGLTHDDTLATGNTRFIVDHGSGASNRTGSTNLGHEPSGVTGPTYLAIDARRRGEEQAEDLRVVISENGTSGPYRPITVVRGPAKVYSDQYTTASVTNAATTDAATAQTLALDDALTAGAANNPGLGVKIANAAHGTTVLRVADVAATAGGGLMFNVAPLE